MCPHPICGTVYAGRDSSVLMSPMSTQAAAMSKKQAETRKNSRNDNNRIHTQILVQKLSKFCFDDDDAVHQWRNCVSIFFLSSLVCLSTLGHVFYCFDFRVMCVVCCVCVFYHASYQHERRNRKWHERKGDDDEKPTTITIRSNHFRSRARKLTSSGMCTTFTRGNKKMCCGRQLIVDDVKIFWLPYGTWCVAIVCSPVLHTHTHCHPNEFRVFSPIHHRHGC